MKSPIKNGTVAVPFGKKGRLWAWLGWHTGVDIIAKIGTRVLATSNQTVIRADGKGGSYGTFVVARDRAERIHIYAHLSHIDVKVGDQLIDGTLVGRVGTTGNSTGPHLHYEVRTGFPTKLSTWGNPINPRGWLN